MTANSNLVAAGLAIALLLGNGTQFLVKVGERLQEEGGVREAETTSIKRMFLRTETLESPFANDFEEFLTDLRRQGYESVRFYAGPQTAALYPLARHLLYPTEVILDSRERRGPKQLQADAAQKRADGLFYLGQKATWRALAATDE